MAKIVEDPWLFANLSYFLMKLNFVTCIDGSFQVHVFVQIEQELLPDMEDTRYDVLLSTTKQRR